MSAGTIAPSTVGVIGAGILGLSIARRIQRAWPDAQLTVMDKEDSVARHQTGHNSGVVHAGLYYKPGSLKAMLCRQGADLLRLYCDERGLPYEECGKLVIATTQSEISALRDIEKRATENLVPGLRWVGSDEISSIEPCAAGVAAVHSPATAITDFVAVCKALAAEISQAGGHVVLSTEVAAMKESLGCVEVLTTHGENLRFDCVVVCAGLQSDSLARTAGDSIEPAIVPFRGEYLKLVPERARLVRGLIYPVPDPNYPFLGVHFTRRVDGSVDIGPNAVLATAREGYRRRDFSVTEMASLVRYPGFWQLARRHWRMGAVEVAGSASKTLFIQRAKRYIPTLTTRDVTAAHSGVRAQAVDRSGELVDDFRIHTLNRITVLRNAPSPAATSAFAIADYVVDRMLDG